MTNTFKILCLLFLCVSVFLINGVNSRALTSNFSVDDISENEKNDINFDVSLITKAPRKKAIQCFDVNEKGMIALGHELIGMSKMISVYDSDGNFKYGYSFDASGTFGVEWNGDYLNIYLVRGDLLVTVDCEANIIDMARVQDTKENNRYYNNYIDGCERLVGDTKYIIRNQMGILNFVQVSYSQLVKISEDGTETILHDVNAFQLAKTIIIPILIVTLFCAVGYKAFKRYKAEK